MVYGEPEQTPILAHWNFFKADIVRDPAYVFSWPSDPLPLTATVYPFPFNICWSVLTCALVVPKTIHVVIEPYELAPGLLGDVTPVPEFVPPEFGVHIIPVGQFGTMTCFGVQIMLVGQPRTIERVDVARMLVTVVVAAPGSNVMVMDLLEDRLVIVQVLVARVVQPDHDARCEFDCAVACRVMVEPP